MARLEKVMHREYIRLKPLLLFEDPFFLHSKAENCQAVLPECIQQHRSPFKRIWGGNLHCRDLDSAEKFRRMFQVKAETCNSTSSLFDFSFCVFTCGFMPMCVFVCAGTHVCMCVCVSTSSVVSQVLSILGFETGSLIGLELTK